MNYVELNGAKLPYNLSNRAKDRFEQKHKILIAEMKPSFKNLTNLALEALNEGADIEGGEKYDYKTLQDMDARAEVSIINTILESIKEDTGKPEASTTEA